MATDAIASSGARTFNKFYLVPSGDTDDDPKLLPKQIFSALNAEGRNQALKVAEHLSSIPIGIIYCSDSPNAIETATKINEKYNCQIISTYALREFQYGRLAGRPISDYHEIIIRIKGSKKYNTFEKRCHFPFGEGSETVQDVSDRMTALFKYVLSQQVHTHILFVSHPRVINAFVASLLQRDIDAVAVAPSGFAVISKASDDDHFRFWGGKNISISSRMPTEGLFETTFLTSDIDEGWGSLSSNRNDEDKKLQKARKQLFTLLADAHFTKKDKDVTSPDFLQLYQLAMPPEIKEKAKRIKESFLKELRNYAIEIVRDDDVVGEGFAEGIKGVVLPASHRINHYLMCLYECGDTTMLSSYTHYLENYFGGYDGVQSFVFEWVQKVYSDFKSRKPISYPMMAKLISERSVGKVSIAEMFPFSNIPVSFDILIKLAALHVKEAEDGLTHVYSTSFIGKLQNKVELNLPAEERIEWLGRLARQGNEKAQEALATIYHDNEPNISLDWSLENRLRRLKEGAFVIGSSDAAACAYESDQLGLNEGHLHLLGNIRQEALKILLLSMEMLNANLK